MIQINLLPEEFRIKPPDPKKGQYFKVGIGVGVMIVLLTLYFFIEFLTVSAKIKSLDQKWKQVQPQSQELNALKAEVEGTLKQEQDFLKQFVTTQKPVTLLMVWVSELLPDGVWLEEMSLAHDLGKVDFLLRGDAMNTKAKTSIEQIEGYLQGLKQKLSDVKLTLKTSRMAIGETELTQFVSNFTWNETSGTTPV